MTTDRLEWHSEAIADGFRLQEGADHHRLVEKWLYEDLSKKELVILPAELRARVQTYFRKLVRDGLRSADAGGWIDGHGGFHTAGVTRARRDRRDGGLTAGDIVEGDFLDEFGACSPGSATVPYQSCLHLLLANAPAEADMSEGWKGPWYRAALVGDVAVTCPEHAALPDDELKKVAVERLRAEGSYGAALSSGGTQVAVYDEDHIRIEPHYTGSPPCDC